MSSNDYLEIHKEGSKYKVSLLDADTQNGTVIASERSLRKAIEKAKHTQESHRVEYGIHFGAI